MGWGCSRCGRPERTDPAAPEDERRRLRNCDGDTYRAFHLPAAPGLRRCPWSVFTGAELLMVGWWERWRRLGVWPLGDGPHDQPAYVVEAFDVLTAEEQEASR